MVTKELNWSDWLDFDEKQISRVPQKPGVFRMHASMKILYIGNAENIQESLRKLLKNPCTGDASRFCYVETTDHKNLKENVLKEHQEKHEGKLPKCMDSN